MSMSELTGLAYFLRKHNVNDGYLADVYAVDGFQACVAISPEPTPPAVWMDELFGGDFPDDKNALEIQYDRMERHLSYLRAWLVAQLPSYQPLFSARPGLGAWGLGLGAWGLGLGACAAPAQRLVPRHALGKEQLVDAVIGMHQYWKHGWVD